MERWIYYIILVFACWNPFLILPFFQQPWNAIVGNTLGGIAGVISWKIAYNADFVACALAVCLAIIFMSYARAVHPPGGAAALIACLDPIQRERGWDYVLFPAFLSSVVQVCVGLLYNNLAARDVQRRYPMYWVPFKLPRWCYVWRWRKYKRSALPSAGDVARQQEEEEEEELPVCPAESTTVPGPGAAFHFDVATMDVDAVLADALAPCSVGSSEEGDFSHSDV